MNSILVAALAILLGAGWIATRDTSAPIKIRDSFIKGEIVMSRTSDGVMEFSGEGDLDFAFALGFGHAQDRVVQMYLQLAVGRGKLSEWFADTPQSIGIDGKFRELDFESRSEKIYDQMSAKTRSFLQAYADGVNHYLDLHPWFLSVEFAAVFFRPPRWIPQYSIVVSFLFGYAGLSSIQENYEKALFEIISSGGDANRIRALFSPYFDGLDDETVKLLQQLKIVNPSIPLSYIDTPVFTASNNWVVSGKLSETGGALLATDPHLEISRLPGVFSEFIFHDREGECGENHGFLVGISLPGLASMIMGRTKHVGWGITFGCMDQTDWFIEKVENGNVLSENGKFVPLLRRNAQLSPKSSGKQNLSFYHTPNGILDVGNFSADFPIKNGLYLSRAWSWDRYMSAKNIEKLITRPRMCSAKQVAESVRDLAMSANYVIADRDGNIAYQQTGLLPLRADNMSGLAPIRGWDASQRWRDGVVSPSSLLYVENPKRGFFVTANEKIQKKGEKETQSLHTAAYRSNRAAEMILEISKKGKKLSVANMKEIQTDLVSIQAREIMKIISKFVPKNSKPGNALLSWDYQYRGGDVGARLFDEIYFEFLFSVFGDTTLGRRNMMHLRNTTGFMNLMQHHFDKIIFSEDEKEIKRWFGEQGRDHFFKLAVQKVMKEHEEDEILPGYSEDTKMLFRNIFFQGKLPSFLGFDYGPVLQDGSPNTLVQGGTRIERGMRIAIGAAWRFVTDMSSDTVFCINAGGPSGNRFSPYYLSDLVKYLNREYKKIVLQ